MTAKVIILGTSFAIPSVDHENTHMVAVGQTQTILIDCVNHPILRLQQAGVDHKAVTDLILTHFHPDHVSGVPSLLMNAWLLGRKRPLTIHGLGDVLDKVSRMMELYNWDSWPNFFKVGFNSIAEEPGVRVIDGPEFRITTSPVKHIVPTLGMRIEGVESGRVLAYSCDTEPAASMVDLASGADILIHEASGNSYGHTSTEQAGGIARKAGVGKLYLIHYPTGEFAQPGLAEQAAETFGGPVELARDFLTLEL